MSASTLTFPATSSSRTAASWESPTTARTAISWSSITPRSSGRFVAPAVVRSSFEAHSTTSAARARRSSPCAGSSPSSSTSTPTTPTSAPRESRPSGDEDRLAGDAALLLIAERRHRVIEAVRGRFDGIQLAALDGGEHVIDYLLV